MTTLRKALPALLALVALWVLTSRQAQAQAQNDCTAFTTTATGDHTGQSVKNLSQNNPCVNWRVTFSTTGTLSTSVTFETSPDDSTYTAVPNTICSSTVQPPCVLQGTNPATGTQGTMYLSAYGAYVHVTTSSSSGAGTVTIRVYGAKGATANAGSGGGATGPAGPAGPTGPAGANANGAGVGLGFYLDDTNIIPTGANNVNQVNTLTQTPVTSTPTVTDTLTPATNTVQGESYFYPTALGLTVIPGGIWTANIYAAVNNAAGTSTVTFNAMAVTPYTTNIVTSGAGTSRTATAASGTPFAVCSGVLTACIVANADPTIASFLQTPQGLYQITARTSDLIVTITVPGTYTNENPATSYSTWTKLFGATTPDLTTAITLQTVPVAQPAYTVIPATRLGVLTFATSTASRTVSFTHNGTSTYSNLQTPMGIVDPAGSFDCPDATGSTTAYTCPISNPQATQYATGMLVAFKPQVTNTTTTPTLDVAALGTKNLVANTGGAASLTVGELVGGSTYLFEYDGAALRLTSGAGGGGSGTVTNTGTLTANAVILGNGGVDVKPGAVLPADATKFYNGAGAFTTPGGGGVAVTPPVQADWTAFNTTGMVLAPTFQNSRFEMQASSQGGENLQGVSAAVPATPYVRTMRIWPMAASKPFGKVAIGWGDGTKFVTVGITPNSGFIPQWEAINWNTVTSINSNPAIVAPVTNTQVVPTFLPMWFQLEDDGTNRKCSVSFDGTTFVALYTATSADFLTPTLLVAVVSGTGLSATSLIFDSFQ